MIFRFLYRILNDEKVINRLSESYVIRRAAQMTVATFYRSKAFMKDNNMQAMTPERFREFIRSFQGHLKKELEESKRQLERNNKKKF